MWRYNNAGEVIFSVVAIVISFTIHEYCHALVSTIQGDDIPGRYGRLSLNPIDHIDFIGFISLFLFGFGWAKPVPISSGKYKNPRLGIILTSFAGPLSNLLLGFLSLVTIYILKPQSEGIQYFLSQLVVINVGLAVFNMIPVPPLDGSKIFGEIFGGKVADLIYRIDRVGIMILFLLLWLPPVENALTGAINGVIDSMIGVINLFV